VTPAKHMKPEALHAELKRLHKKWDDIRADDEGGGGSPGEWIWERMGEIDHEIKRREAGGALQTEIPMQSR
jgi:hypothetical protein